MRFYAAEILGRGGTGESGMERDPRQCWVAAAVSPWRRGAGELGMGGSAGLEPQRHLGGAVQASVAHTTEQQFAGAVLSSSRGAIG